MKTKTHFIYLFCLLIVAACTEKSIDIEVEQEACKRFKISNPNYQLLDDPCSGSSRLRARVEFEYNRSLECLDRLNNYPAFYRLNNDEISANSYSATISRENLSVNDKKVSYIFEAEFSSPSAAQELNHLILDFNTQNELGTASNKLQIRINTSCSSVDPSSYTVNDNEVDIPPFQNFFTIRLWDNAAEDGDIVSVFLNGQWIIENHSLLKDGTNFTFPTTLLRSGANDLVVFALNEGESGPNTVSIAINGQEIQNFKPGLLTGEAVRINF